jgi:hypothetical protein
LKTCATLKSVGTIGYAVKTLESKETRAQRILTTVTHNSVFAAHRLNAGQQPHVDVRHFRCTRESTAISDLATALRRRALRLGPRIRLRPGYGGQVTQIDANICSGEHRMPVRSAGWTDWPWRARTFGRCAETTSKVFGPRNTPNYTKLKTSADFTEGTGENGAKPVQNPDPAGVAARML